MEIKVNDEVKEIAAGTSLAGLAEEMNLPKSGVAIALNDSVVPRKTWEQTTLGEGDTVIIISAAYGG